ncbi:MAG: 4Fe-4S binding protein [Candidatus Hydrogenedentes bacterium]|nr:4Fe-4S binding protein [Candidatus Hydrogenedentota bacterium]
MTLKARGRWLVWARRVIQGACLVLFLWMVLGARSRETGAPGEFYQLFFDFDPLLLVATWLAAHKVPLIMLLSLVTLGVTLVFGRVFCGWVCPLGTIHTMVSALRLAPRDVLVRTENWTRWHLVKYYLLTALVVMALFGSHWIGVFDPLSILYRATTTTLLPGTQYAIEESSTAIYHADPHIGPLHFTSITEPIYRFFRDRVFLIERQSYFGSGFILTLFAAMVLLNLYRKRFWCRYACPLGALLGVFARRPLFRVVTLPDKCNQCALCRVNCQGAARPDQPGDQLPSECFACYNCAALCNWNAITCRFEPPFRAVPLGKLDVSKRALITSGVAGLGSLLMLRLAPQAQARTYNPVLIRPPGARSERDFLERCIQCGLCMKVCPTNGLQPTWLEAGLEGIWTPRLVPRIGYCEYNCNLCCVVCPTEAIQPLTLVEKNKVKIGLATIDTTRCLPYAYDRDCIVCEEHCPVPNKAIYFVAKEVPLRHGGTRIVKQPHIDPELCTGCSECETKCVFKDHPAVRVTSANESRHSPNQPILPGLGGRNAAPATSAAPSPYGDYPPQ